MSSASIFQEICCHVDTRAWDVMYYFISRKREEIAQLCEKSKEAAKRVAELQVTTDLLRQLKDKCSR